MSRAVKTRSMSVFLLLYYNQVIGLSAALVSTLILVTVILDAVVDPAIGQVSDNFRSRLGRRHPFMYAAAAPVALLFFLLWNPPVGLSESMTAAYMFVVLVALRFFDTFFELPAEALLPELVEDYDKRTQLVAIRQFFSNVTTLGVTILAYQVFLKENPDGSGGVLEREGYLNFSIAGAAVMFAAILISTIGTHRQIPWLRRAPAKTPPLGRMLRESLATLRNRSFAAAIIAAICMAVAIGLKGALDIYWYLYLFGLTQSQLALMTLVGTGGTILGIALGPGLIRRLGKRSAAIAVFTASFVLISGPLGLWLLDLTPPRGSDALFVLLAADQFLAAAMWFVISVSAVSMLADVVDDAEVKTGRRSEGLLFAAQGFFQKAVGGLGVFTSGMILTLAEFPRGAERSSVPDSVLTELALYYLPVVALLHVLAIFGLTQFRIDRATHEANLAALRRTPSQVA